MLALGASIHVLNTTSGSPGEDVDGRDKPDHDGRAVFMGSGLSAPRCPGMTVRHEFEGQ